MASQERYSAGAVWLHWLIALSLAFQLGLGFAMPEGAKGFAAIQLHKSIGISILLLTLARLGWRILRKPPAALESGWQARLAGAVHLALYAFMILAPLTGWAMVSTARVRIPTVLFGRIPWPHLPLPTGTFDLAEQSHEVLGYIGAALIALHVAGAMRHHLLLRDRVLERMAPGGATSAALVFLSAAIVLFAVPFAWPYSREGKSPAAVSQGRPIEVAAETPEATPTPAVEESSAAEAATPQADETPVPPRHWTIQSGGSLTFSLSNGDDRIAGRFTKWSGAIAFDPDHPETADIRIDIDLASATVGDPTQDEMLGQAEFLGPAGKATWRSTSVRKTGDGRYSAQGRLSLKGQSRSVPLTFTLRGGKDRKTAVGKATLDRTAFGVGSGDAAAALSPAVNVEFSFEAVGN